MIGLLWNLLLALMWAAVTSDLSRGNLLLGFGLGFLVLAVSQRAVGAETYIRRVRQALRLGAFFLWELILANLRVAYDVVRPRFRMQPGVVAVPLDATTDAEITLLANLITLTPGSVALEVSSDGRALYVHTMYVTDGDPEKVRREIKEGFERRVLEVLR